MAKNKEPLIYGPKLARSIAWNQFAFQTHRVDSAVFLDVFQEIYSAIERRPGITLEDAAPQILAQLQRK